MKDMMTLFARDPLGLSNEDIDDIILHMRSLRTSFTSKPKPLAKAKAKKPSKEETRLGDLVNVEIEL